MHGSSEIVFPLFFISNHAERRALREGRPDYFAAGSIGKVFESLSKSQLPHEGFVVVLHKKDMLIVLPICDTAW